MNAIRVLLLSLAALTAGRDLLGAVTFTALLLLKHIFVYAAPFYFVYLLRHYCFPEVVGVKSVNHEADPAKSASSEGSEIDGAEGASLRQGRLQRGQREFSLRRLVTLGAACVAVVAVVLAPFVLPHVDLSSERARHTTVESLKRELAQLISRLFPWGRGLVHAYWAPNVWALYVFTDTVLAKIGAKVGLLGGGTILGNLGVRMWKSIFSWYHITEYFTIIMLLM